MPSFCLLLIVLSTRVVYYQLFVGEYICVSFIFEPTSLIKQKIILILRVMGTALFSVIFFSKEDSLYEFQDISVCGKTLLKRSSLLGKNLLL